MEDKMLRRLGMFGFAFALGCAGEPAPTDDTDTDTDGDTDTGDGEGVVWIDRTIETSVTLNAVYTGGTGAWVFGDGGIAWKISQGSPQSLDTGASDALRGVWGREMAAPNRWSWSDFPAPF
jgi:hypothetical protein